MAGASGGGKCRTHDLKLTTMNRFRQDESVYAGAVRACKEAHQETTIRVPNEKVGSFCLRGLEQCTQLIHHGEGIAAALPWAAFASTRPVVSKHSI
jgi:hypothetical protein